MTPNLFWSSQAVKTDFAINQTVEDGPPNRLHVVCQCEHHLGEHVSCVVQQFCVMLPLTGIDQTLQCKHAVIPCNSLRQNAAENCGHVCGAERHAASRQLFPCAVPAAVGEWNQQKEEKEQTVVRRRGTLSQAYYLSFR